MKFRLYCEGKLLAVAHVSPLQTKAGERKLAPSDRVVLVLTEDHAPLGAKPLFAEALLERQP